MAGYNTALLNGTVCEYWHNLQLDDCLIEQPNDEELEYQTYWIHPDHLGSGSVITNQLGATTNWYEYMPFGEILMEQSSGDYNNVYKYNGKEMDFQTGLYYYGARYYDPQRSFWLSVDPLVEKTISPYSYINNNPVNFIDPTGMIGEDPPGSSKLTGSKNLVVYINEHSINEKMYKESQNWDFIATNSIDNVKEILQGAYGKNIPEFENLVVKSHALLFNSPILNKTGEGLNAATVRDASKSSGLKFLESNLSKDANIVFTGYNFAMGYTQANNAVTPVVDSFTELFLKDDRNVMFNVAFSSSNNLHYKNGDVSE